MALGGYDGSIRIDSKIETKGFNAGIKSMMSSLKGLAAAVGLAFGIGAIVLFGKSAVSAASDLAAALTGLQSVTQGTGKSFSEAQKFIDDYVSDGLVPATNAINAYKNLALRGYDTSQIEKTMQALKDSAAFGRQSGLTLGQAVQGATEGLKNENSVLVDNAGVTKNVAKMWQEYAESIGTTANNLTQQQKIQAEVAGILEETKFQTGDAAKLTQGYAGQVAALGTSFYNLKVAVGNTIIPILSKIIPVVKAAVDWLVVLLNQFAQFMSVLFGVQLGVDAVASSTQAAADATQDQADATEAAEKAAKGALAAFDELNVLQTDQAASTKTGSEPVIALPPVEVEAVDKGLDGLKDKIDALKQKLSRLFDPTLTSLKDLWTALAPLKAFAAQGAIDFYEHFLKPVGTWVLGEGLPRFISAITNGLMTVDWPTLNAALATLWDALAPFAVHVGEGLLWLWENVLVPLAAWSIGDLLPVFLQLVAAGIGVLDATLEALKPLALWFFTQFLKPLAEWTGGAILDVLKWLADRLTGLSDWMTKHQGTVETLTIVLGSFAAAWWLVHTAITAWTTIGPVATAVVTAFGSAEALATTFTTAFGAAVAFLTSPITLTVLAIGALIAVLVLLVRHWDDVQKAAGKAWEWIKNAWQDAGDWFHDEVSEQVTKGFNVAWEDVKIFSSRAWRGITETWGEAGEWFRSRITTPLQEAFGAALDWVEDKWHDVFTDVKSFVKQQINAIIDFINGMISAIASGINAVIDGLNSIQVKVPDWIPVFGGKSWGLNLPAVEAPQIPRLATGAVIPPNAEFAAILGDQRNGRNLEAPEGLIRQIIREEVGQVQADVRIAFGGSLAALVRELKPYIDQESVRVGGSLVQGVVKP